MGGKTEEHDKRHSQDKNATHKYASARDYSGASLRILRKMEWVFDTDDIISHERKYFCLNLEQKRSFSHK